MNWKDEPLQGVAVKTLKGNDALIGGTSNYFCILSVIITYTFSFRPTHVFFYTRFKQNSTSVILAQFWFLHTIHEGHHTSL